MNNWNFTGNLGRSAEQKFVGDNSLVSFSVAVKSGYGDKAATTWVNCQMWGKRGESVLPYLNKGQLVGISGEATLRLYEKKDGGNGASLDVRVNDLTLLGKSDPMQDLAPVTEHSAAKANAYVPDNSDEAPF
jgi:single-strand DNA-binding protein